MLADAPGPIRAATVPPADIRDRDAAERLLPGVAPGRTRTKTVFADEGHGGRSVQWLMPASGRAPKLVQRPPGTKGSVPRRKRWIVGRTFARLDRRRRHGKDREQLPRVSEAMTHVAVTGIVPTRLA